MSKTYCTCTVQNKQQPAINFPKEGSLIINKTDTQVKKHTDGEEMKEQRGGKRSKRGVRRRRGNGGRGGCHLWVCLALLSSLACAFICCTSMVSGLRRLRYSSWLPMHRARIRLLMRRRGALNTKSYRMSHQTVSE